MKLWYSVPTKDSPLNARPVVQKHKSGFQISYVTITYRSVFLGLLGVFVLAGVVMGVALGCASITAFASFGLI